MYKLLVLSSILVLSILCGEARSECDISGIWKHSAKPAKLFVDLGKAQVSVYSHEDTPNAMGEIVLKDLKSNTTSLSWRAKMYSAAENSFVDVEITSKHCDQLSVNFNQEEVLGLVR